MTKEEKKRYNLLSRRRYGELTSKKDKGAFLDQFCAATGMDRKNAIRRLSPKERPHRRQGRPFKADVAARNVLVRIWKLADYFKGKAEKEGRRSGRMLGAPRRPFGDASFPLRRRPRRNGLPTVKRFGDAIHDAA